MPELPEVECVRRSLLPVLVGATLERVVVNRAGVVRVCGGGGKDNKADPPPGPLPPGREGEQEGGTGDHLPEALMRGMRVGAIARHGKQLAIVGKGETGQAGGMSGGGGCVVVHLGMSGQLRWSPADDAHEPRPPHTHVVWRTAQGELRFTDPRRFGGLGCYPSLDAARASRWDKLGPDALGATPGRLHAALTRTGRPLKPALLDQHVVAGLGNIYVDELLFGAKLHPAMPANTVTRAQAASLARRMRTLRAGTIESNKPRRLREKCRVSPPSQTRPRPDWCSATNCTKRDSSSVVGSSE